MIFILYSQKRIKVPLINPPIPSTRTIVSKPEGSEMCEYQLEDEMGLGKKIQILSFLSYLNKNTVRTSTFKQWFDEIERWTDLRYIAFNSGPAQRRLIRTYICFHFLTITKMQYQIRFYSFHMISLFLANFYGKFLSLTKAIEFKNST